MEKTSILEAIHFFYKGVDEAKPEEAFGLIPKKNIHSFAGEISVIAFIKIEKDDKKLIKEKIEKEFYFLINKIPDEITIVRTIIFENSRPTEHKKRILTFSAQGKKKKTSKKLDISFLEWIKKNEKIDEFNDFFWKEFLPEIIYYENFIFNFPEKIYFKSEYAKNSEVNEKYLNILESALKSKNKKLNIDTDILQELKKNDEISEKKLDSLKTILEDKLEKHISSELNNIFNKEEDKNKIFTIKLTLLKNINNSEDAAFTLKINQGEELFVLSEKSLGFRWFFSYLFFTVFHKEGENNFKKTLFLFDEPASNLHQSLQKKLKEKFISISKKRYQIIYSTHSHNLIIPRFLSSAYIVKNNAINYKNPLKDLQRNTDIKAILYKRFTSKQADQRDYFQPILDALQYKPSELELVDFIVMVEGKIDYYLFRYMNEIIFEDKNKINFYPGNGVSSLKLPILLYTSWNRNFLTLLDSDNAGINAKKQYKKNIGEVICNKIFSLKDICKEWTNFKTEDLFSKEDKRNIIKKVFEESNENDFQDKNKLSLAIQEMWVKKEFIEISEKSKSNFKKVFKFIFDKKEENKTE